MAKMIIGALRSCTRNHRDLALENLALRQQLVEACGMDECLKYLIRDRDAIYKKEFSQKAQSLGIQEVLTAYRSPWQNPYAERVIGSIRRECLDHIIVLGPRHLKRIMNRYLEYYNGVRTRLSLNKDAPDA